MAASAWKGAVELGGFPVNVRLYGRVKSRSGESFKTIAPDGLPVRSVYLDSNGDEVSRDECSKGVMTAKDTFAVLTPEALESIADIEKSSSVEPAMFCPLDSIPFELAVNSYTVVPDKDVPGAERPVGILWNGLAAQNLAYVTQVAMRAGSRDAIIVIYPEGKELRAVALPFAAELHEPPTREYEEDEKASSVFAQFVETQYGDLLGRFDHEAFASEWRERRQAAIASAVDGKPLPTPETPKAAAGPDLMAVLEQSVKDAGAKAAKPKAKKPAAKKGSRSKAKVAA